MAGGIWKTVQGGQGGIAFGKRVEEVNNSDGEGR